MLDVEFEKLMNEAENAINLLGHENDPNYADLLNNKLERFRTLGSKLKFWYSHKDYFPDNLGKVNEQ